MPESTSAALRWAPSPLESVARSRRIFNAVIEHPCPACDAPAQAPCLTIEPGFTHSATCQAVCSERVERWKRHQRATGPKARPNTPPKEPQR